MSPQEPERNPRDATSDLVRQWIRGWEVAGPQMQQMRDDRLRRMSEAEGAKMLGAGEASHPDAPEANGLAIWQSWMMRLRIQQLSGSVGQTHR